MAKQRRLGPLELRMRKEYTGIHRCGRGDNAPTMTVGNQTFCVGFACDLLTARWQQRQFAIALANLVTMEKSK